MTIVDGKAEKWYNEINTVNYDLASGLRGALRQSNSDTLKSAERRATMKYNKSTCAIELSVRSLCELAAKHGSIDNRHSKDARTLTVGGEIHRKLQSEAGGYYNPEVSLVNTTLYDGIYYTVSGRADGVIRTPEGLCVDEIKSVGGYEFRLPPDVTYMAQLKCYAYFLCVREELTEIKGRLTYFNIDTEKTRYFHYSFTLSELREFYVGLLEKISGFARLEVYRQVDVLPMAARATFPYTELREGQEMMIRECYGAIRRGQRLFVEAPTGTGKTISSLYPAVRALGEGMTDKIFYLTAKASTRREAYTACGKLFEAGSKIRAVVLNSKESMCRCYSRISGQSGRNMCNPDDCPFARGYYDKVNEALGELLTTYNGYPAKAVLAVAEKYGICPYELSLDLSEYCDVIICDYNYAFDPTVYLRRYFGEGGRREKYVFLVDEAHNLADRARDMYSATLCLSDVLELRDKCGGADGELDSILTSLTVAFGNAKKLCRDSLVRASDGTERGFYINSSTLPRFGEELELFRKKCDTWMKNNRESEFYDGVYVLSGEVKKYLCVSEYFDKGFLSYVEVLGGNITVKIFCLDPSALMKSLLRRSVATALFSATLTPAEYFCDVLGCADEGITVSLPSPFEPDDLMVAVADFVSVRFEDRAANIGKYVSVIAATVSAKAGNYMVYFPSYDCLEKVHTAFSKKYPKVETVVQSKGMGMREREDFLGAFKADKGHLRVGFCVLGGAFSEGVDLPGSRLIGAVIFGVGLPGLSNERNIIRDYFDGEGEGGRGYDYAYTFPGMNNVLQAAGRVIRTDRDRGVVVLVDDRYAEPLYRGLFPEHWKNLCYARNVASLAELTKGFWKNREQI